MRQFHYLLLLLASFVFITACSDDDFYASPVLKVSKTSLEFDKTTSQASVDVTKNKNDEFYAMLSGDQEAEWLKVVYTDSGFNVVVENNKGTTDRIATITLLLKNGTLPTPVTVRVKQSKESDLSLSLTGGDQHFRLGGGEVVVRLEGNITKTGWTVSTDADWIMLVAAGLDYKFNMKVLPNSAAEDRAATVTVVTEQGATAKIKISQDKGLKWELPFLDMGYNLETRKHAFPGSMTDVTKFEEHRGSTFYRTSYVIQYTWNTLSTLIPQYNYYIAIGEITLREVVGIVSNTYYWTDPLYEAYLASEGFTLTYADDGDLVFWNRRIVYWNKEREVAIIHSFDTKEVEFIQARNELHHHVDGQMRPCPTFEQLPDYFFDVAATLTDVDAWEATQKSTPLDRGPISYTYTPNPSMSKEKFLERVYLFKDDKVSETWLLFEDIELVFFRDGNINYYLATAEFKALMEAAGFVIEAEDPYNGILFSHAAKNIDLYASVKGYESEDMLPRLVLQIAPLGFGGGGEGN